VRLPEPEPGLVIRYSNLWLREHREGREEGTKDRPCAIVLAARNYGDGTQFRVSATHGRPENLAAALELPPAVNNIPASTRNAHGVALSKSNLFDWPAPGPRRVGYRDNSFGRLWVLPPRRFAELRRRALEMVPV